ncbi:DUF2249 domain-containing protein [Pelagibaculum spongiae]|uniref:DUF2249 domain-containing protein n=1 Tax=Pelagibaculum spongiae TaxID=2080658 RepID=A0A2V1H113_9GAMM|nr:DUF2249 domain-containing protein [Pelagibaculum spongiae]PVZ68989.1 hypothetical protein DC094_12145 [Pelagibaculum spongiae]
MKLDVSQLEPPEPMKKISQALLTFSKQLEQGEVLEVLHRREPLPLYPKLIEMGLQYTVEPVFPPGFKIRISKA